MSNFEGLYARFMITEKKAESLRRLNEPTSHVGGLPDRLVFETVIIENGERRVLKTEVQGG